jgi:hypothetical protein
VTIEDPGGIGMPLPSQPQVKRCVAENDFDEMSRCCCGVRHDHAQRTAGARIDLAAYAGFSDN